MKKSYLCCWDAEASKFENIIGIILRFCTVVILATVIHLLTITFIQTQFGNNLFWGKPAILVELSTHNIQDATVFIQKEEDQKSVKYKFIERYYYEFFNYDFPNTPQGKLSFVEVETLPSFEDYLKSDYSISNEFTHEVPATPFSAFQTAIKKEGSYNVGTLYIVSMGITVFITCLILAGIGCLFIWIIVGNKKKRIRERESSFEDKVEREKR